MNTLTNVNKWGLTVKCYQRPLWECVHVIISSVTCTVKRLSVHFIRIMLSLFLKPLHVFFFLLIAFWVMCTPYVSGGIFNMPNLISDWRQIYECYRLSTSCICCDLFLSWIYAAPSVLLVWAFIYSPQGHILRLFAVIVTKGHAADVPNTALKTQTLMLREFQHWNVFALNMLLHCLCDCVYIVLIKRSLITLSRNLFS